MSRKSWWTRGSSVSSGWKVAARRWPWRTRVGRAVAGGEGFDVGAGAGDAGGADEDHLERAAGEGGFGGEDGGVVLAAVGVALDGDVEDAEGGLRRVGDFFGEEDAAGAGAEGGFGVDEGVEGVEEAGALEVLEEGGGLAAGDDEAVEVVELARACGRAR